MLTWFFIWTIGVAPGVVGMPVTIGGFTSELACKLFRDDLNARVQVVGPANMPAGWSTTVCQAKS